MLRSVSGLWRPYLIAVVSKGGMGGGDVKLFFVHRACAWYSEYAGDAVFCGAHRFNRGIILLKRTGKDEKHLSHLVPRLQWQRSSLISGELILSHGMAIYSIKSINL